MDFTMKIKLLNSQTLKEDQLTVETDLNNECMIGRSLSCRLVLESADVSRVHAKITLKEGQYSFQDLGSTNGSLVNGEIAVANHPYVLKIGDTLRMGEFILTIEEVTPSAREIGDATVLGRFNVAAMRSQLETPLAPPIPAVVVPEPAAAVAPEPVAAVAPEPVVEAAPEPVAAAVSEPIVEAAPEPVVEPVPEPVAAVAPEPVAAAVSEPVVEATPEPVAAAPEPAAEAAEGRRPVRERPERAERPARERPPARERAAAAEPVAAAPPAGTVQEGKYLAVMANETLLPDLIQLASQYKALFAKCRTIALPAISEALSQQAELAISQLAPAVPLKAYQEVTRLIEAGEMEAVILLRDFVKTPSTRTNDENLVKACHVNAVMLATNLPTATAILHYLQSQKG
jgi:methylglyoxal synthase